MKLGWLIKLYLLDDRFIMMLLNTFKFGVVRTKEQGFNGFSIVIGLSRLEIQLNVSLTQEIIIRVPKNGTGKA